MQCSTLHACRYIYNMNFSWHSNHETRAYTYTTQSIFQYQRAMLLFLGPNMQVEQNMPFEIRFLAHSWWNRDLFRITRTGDSHGVLDRRQPCRRWCLGQETLYLGPERTWWWLGSRHGDLGGRHGVIVIGNGVLVRRHGVLACGHGVEHADQETRAQHKSWACTLSIVTQDYI